MNEQACKWIKGPGLATAVLALLYADQASAQQLEATGTTFGEPARQIQVDVSGMSTYDTNVSRSSQAGATARGVAKEDVRLTPAITGNIVLPTPAAVLTLQGSVGYDFFRRNSQLNRERISLLAGAGTKVASCDVSAQLGYARLQSDLADLSIVPGDTETSTVNVQTTTRVGGSVACGGTIRPTAFIDYRSARNSAVRRRVSNVSPLTYGGGVGYSNPRFGVVTVFISRSEFDFSDREPFAGAVRSFDVTAWGIRLDRRLGARLQVHSQVSYVDVSGAGPTGDRFDGFNWDASAALRIGTRAQFSLSAARQIDATAAFNLRTAQVSSYAARLDYVFSPLLRGSLSAALRERTLDSDPTLLPIVLLGDDRTVDIAGRLSYSLGQRIKLTAGANYLQRQADVAIYDYDSFRGSIGLSLEL